MALKIAKEIIEEIEGSVAYDKRRPFKTLGAIHHEFTKPLFLLTEGSSLWFRSFKKCGIFIILFIVITAFVSKKIDSTELIQMMYMGSFMIPILVSTFSSPSSFSFYGVRENQIEKVCQLLETNNVICNEQVAPIRNTIKLSEDRVKKRILGLKAFLYLSWSLFIFCSTTIFKGAMASQEKSIPLEILIPSFIVVILLYIFTQSYSAIDMSIFQNALISCDEYEFRLFTTDGQTCK